MSMDPSLKSASALVRHRNVLTRGERLAKLAEQGKWDDGKSVFGLVKVGHRKMVIGGKDKKAEGDEAVAGAPAAKGAAGAKGAAAAKGAAPAGKAAAGKAPAGKAPAAKAAAKK